MIIEITPNQIFQKHTFSVLFAICILFLILSIIFILIFIKNYQSKRKEASSLEIYGIKKPSLTLVLISIFFALISLLCALICFFMYLNIFGIKQIGYPLYIIILFIILSIASIIVNIIYAHKTQNCPL